MLSDFSQLDYDMAPTPRQLYEIYSNGYQGVRHNPFAYAYWRMSIPRFYSVFPEAKGAGKGKASLPFKACLVLEPEFGRYENQTTGDCVSHSTRNAGMIDYCVDALFGETKYKGRFATENIYGARGHGGEGADCATLAGYVSQDGAGGFLVRDKYVDGSNSVDLSTYNGSTGHNWGRSGTPSWLNTIAAQNKAMRVFTIKTVEEERDAIAMGFGVSMCSGYGFAETRNEDGVAEQQGSWSHAMCHIGFDDTDWAHQKYGGPLVLVQNSWALWNSGPKRHEQPDGSFWIKPAVSKRMVSGGEGWAICSVRGYDRVLVYDMCNKIEELSRD